MNLPVRTANGYQAGNLIASNFPPRQSQILLLSALGCSERVIAESMRCSINNVKQAKQAIFFKLRANGTPEAITKAFAGSYLRFASVLVVFLIVLATPVINDHNSLMRLTRQKTNSQLRQRSIARTKKDGGIYWSPDDNKLIFA